MLSMAAFLFITFALLIYEKSTIPTDLTWTIPLPLVSRTQANIHIWWNLSEDEQDRPLGFPGAQLKHTPL